MFIPLVPTTLQLLYIYYVFGTMLQKLQALIHLILTATLWERQNPYSYFTDKLKFNMQLYCLKGHSQEMAELGSELKSV